jgi:hypothetical protein
MNFMASEYWSDGWREESLMPNGHGLRRCTCGAYFVLFELQSLGPVEQTELPAAMEVAAEDLPRAIEQARNRDVQMAARLDYWQSLNHPYRERYRAHRQAEDAEHQAAWERANPDRRTAIQRMAKAPRVPRYRAASDRSITFPAFETSPEQVANMRALLALYLLDSGPPSTLVEMAELYRELGEFDMAVGLLDQLTDSERCHRSLLIRQLARHEQAAPFRYTL